MYKLCKTEQSTARQHEIEEGLLAAMQTRRYDDISVSDLCGQLGIPRKSFYRYFSGKEGALFALLDHRLMAYENRADGKSIYKKDGFAIDLEWFFEFWLRQKSLLDALERSGLSGMLVERAIRNSQEAQVFSYENNSKEYVEAATAFTVCGLMSMMLHWHHDGYRQSVEEIASIALQMLTNPLAQGLKR